MTEKCFQCGNVLGCDDIGLTKKMINRGIQKYLCIHCLSEHFSVSEDILRMKINEFRQMGCTLFINETEDKKDG